MVIKNIKTLGFFLILFLLNSCWIIQSEDIDPFDGYRPIIMNRGDFENSLAILSKKDMVKAGKIYLKDTWMFIGDENTGFHIYDNSNPTLPTEVAFINIPGATDLAIRDNVFYVNQAVDLVAFKIDMDSKRIELLKRIKNVFPVKKSPNGNVHFTDENKIVIDWKKK